MRATHLVAGSDQHGVTVLALQLARAAGAPVVRWPGTPTVAALPRLLALLPPGPLRLHVTDRLWGATPEQASAVLARLLQARPGTVWLHDLPQASDGAANLGRRSLVYAAVARAAAEVVLASEHERALLAEVLHRVPGPPAAQVRVVPLPLVGPTTVGATPVVPGPPTVAVLGFVYPGKGHREVLDALPPGVRLTALGRASDGHADLLDDLARHAAARGREFRCTGWLDDPRLAAEMARASVPVAPHTHVSASGSVGSWLAAGRRPLVARGRWAAELDARLPGALTLYDDLRTALGAALADPATTWLPAGLELGPGVDEVAARYDRGAA